MSWKFVVFFFCWLALPVWLHASTISGTVIDPSGAVIPDARIEISGGGLPQPLEVTSDELGRFSAPDLKAGKYTVRVTHDGFQALEKSVDLQDRLELQLTLAIATAQTNIVVPGLALANSDPVYKKLRHVGFGETFRFDNFTLNYDAGTFQFQKGTLTWLGPVEGIVTGAIFIGEAHFSLKPLPLYAREITRRTGADELNEDFTEVVFRFTGDGRMKLLPGLGDRTEPSSEAAAALRNWRDRCASAAKSRLASPSICCKARPWITSPPTCSPPSTIHRTRHFSTPISTGKSTKTFASS